MVEEVASQFDFRGAAYGHRMIYDSLVVDDEAHQRLARQIEYLRSDQRLHDRASRAAELTMAGRLALTYALCRRAAIMRGQLSPTVRARVEGYREPLGPGAEEALQRYSRLASPGGV